MKEFKNLDAFISNLHLDSNCILLQQSNFILIAEIKNNEIISTYSSESIEKIAFLPSKRLQKTSEILDSENILKHLKTEAKILSNFIKSDEATYIKICIDQSLPIETFDDYLTLNIPNRFTKLEYKNGKPRFRLKDTRFIYQDEFDVEKDLELINKLIQSNS